MAKKQFEGWYFKHQKGGNMVAFIPGRAMGEAFVQVMAPGGSRQFQVPQVREDNGVIYAGNCRFSLAGCKIDLPGISGEIFYSTPTPLASDIMGPFRFFPMECRHGVLSMDHGLRGGLIMDGKEYDFTGGRGYAEMDRGTSFPSSYLWFQCSDFPVPCSLMVSIAKIPFCGLCFTGCICAIVYMGREYRLATYRGVRILAAGPDFVCLEQVKLRLELRITPSQKGHPLRAPLLGQMRGVIRESSNVGIGVRLWENGQTLLDLQSGCGTFEYVPEIVTQE